MEKTLLFILFPFILFVYDVLTTSITDGYNGHANITIGIISDSIFHQRALLYTNNESASVSVIWTLEHYTEPYHVIEAAKNMHQKDVDLIVVSLKSWSHFTNDINLKIPVPIISVGHLYHYGIPSNICGTTNISEIRTTGCKLDYLSNGIEQKSDVIKDTMVSLAVKSRWTTVVIFYENKTASFVENLLKPLSDLGLSDYLKYNFDTLSSVKDIDIVLNRLYHSLNDDGLNVTLLCEINCIKTVMQRADIYDSSKGNKRKTAMHQNSKWLILSVFNQDMTLIPWYDFDLDNVALLDFGCAALTDDQNDFMKQYIFDLRSQMDGLLCGNRKDTSITSVEMLQNHIKEIIQSLDDIIKTYEEKIVFPLKSLLWYKHGRELTTVGQVDMKGKLLLLQNDIYPNTHYGFNRRKFLVTTLSWPPFVKKVKSNGTLVYSGFCIDLLKELATTLNFTYDITEPADQEWGRLRKNNTWTGMIGQLENEEVDLMVAPNSIQASRELVMDFTYPFFFDTMTFLVKRADPNRNKWRTLVDPLSWQVLVCVAISLPTCAFILFVVERYSQYFVFAPEEPHDYQYALWYMLGALLTQGGENPPSSQSGRTVISFWWIFSIILVATYSGNLIAFLTVTKEKLPFKTFDMVAEQTDYVWGVCGGTYIETYFEISPVPAFRKLWRGIQRNLHSHPEILDLNPEIHVKKVLHEDYVFFCDKTYFEILAGKDCRYVIGEEEYPNMNYAVGLPNNSAYTRLFSTKILELLESGLVQIWKEEHWPKQTFCKGTLTTEAKKINMIDVQSAFYLIAIGVTFASLILSAECLFTKIRKYSGRGPPETTNSDNVECQSHKPNST